METKSVVSIFKELLKFSRPWLLLAVTLFYALGVGIGTYLGMPINWNALFLGLAVMLLLFISSGYLKIYYDLLPQAIQVKQDGLPTLPRNSILAAVVSLLTAGAILTVLMAVQGLLTPLVFFFLGIGFLLSFFWGTPPLRLVYSGYGELAVAILVANITPAFAFVLQAGDVHQLLAMLTFPLSALWLAMSIALGFEHYWQNLQANRRELLVRMGWDRAIVLHNSLILSAYVLLLSARALGLAWALTWPGLLTLPVAGYQIWMLWRISQGEKPRWKLLRLTAMTTAVLTAYLFTFALWTV